MSAPPDYYVLNALRQAAAEISVDTPTNRQLVSMILEGAEPDTIDRVTDDLFDKPPTVIQGWGHERPPDPPLWVVLLKNETPEEVFAGAHQVSLPSPFEIDGQWYWSLGGPERQTVQIQAYAENPETVRFHYLFVRSLLYQVTFALVKAQKLMNGYPLAGGDYLPKRELIPAGVPMRFLDWAFIYEATGFVPVDTPADDADVVFGPV